MSFYSFNFLSNNYIGEKKELAKKWIFIRIFMDKRGKMRAFEKDIFTSNVFLIEFSFFMLYPSTHTLFEIPFSWVPVS